MYQKLLLIFYFSATLIVAKAQRSPIINSIEQVIAAVDTFNTRMPSEKLFIHLDKPYYAVGDTLWFKAYLFDGTTHAYSPISGLLYIELITDSNKVIRRICVPVSYGISWGQMALNSEDVPEGSYSILAYTNWMQNFGEDLFFRQRFYITAAGVKNFLVKEAHTITADGDKEDLDLNLQLSNANTTPLKNREINFKIVSGSRQLFKKEIQTSALGIIKEEFALPANNKLSKNIKIILQDKNDPAITTNIPLQISRPQNTDLQFMPEGGYLVAGIVCRVGFKAIAENGLGIDVRGKITDSKNNEVAKLQPVYKGMGVFEIKPVKGESYFAVIDLAGGNTKRFPLPPVKNSGIVIRSDDSKSDSIVCTVSCSPDMIGIDPYYLIGFSRGIICYAARYHFLRHEGRISIAKKNFPSGIAHFSLMNSSGIPVAERLLFIDHSDNLRISSATSQIDFKARDSIAVSLKVTDHNGQPVAGSFSIAVTDDSQVRTDTLNAENIVSRLLLTGELKGNIETPGYYLAGNQNSKQALDALLLTQGWIGYDWQKIYNPSPPHFTAEKEFTLSGTVTNLFERPVSKAQVILLSVGKINLFRDTLTDTKGQFNFSGFPIFDTIGFVVQARNAKGKNFGMGLVLNEFIPPAIKQLPIPVTPWYINGDSILLTYIKNNEEQRIENEKKYKELPTVKIASKKRIKNSLNLNGPGEADQVINETEIENEGKKSLLKLLEQKVTGFRIIYGPNGSQSYKIFSSTVYIIIDGVSLRFFNLGRETLEYLDATDITGIEVMYNSRYAANYSSSFLSIDEMMSTGQYAFIEVTTRSGNGIFMKKVPGMTTYKPTSIYLPRQFYSPRYTINNHDGNNTDKRSTIYWQPNVVTNEKGEATVAFYAADIPGTYSIIIQGSDLQGSVGYSTQKITIK